ncbi:hypothetical protein CDD83_4049 [Cordyceps sp. RAO-2017]|nr:hypothetical protein CDD83_4049 [Cordyceps sp. RAO-2017]
MPPPVVAALSRGSKSRSPRGSCSSGTPSPTAAMPAQGITPTAAAAATDHPSVAAAGGAIAITAVSDDNNDGGPDLTVPASSSSSGQSDAIAKQLQARDRDPAVQNRDTAAAKISLDSAAVLDKIEYLPFRSQNRAVPDAAPTQLSTPSRDMIFSDIYRGPRSPLAKLRQSHSQQPIQPPAAAPDWAAPEHADLLSKDKTKQKEAIKRYLSFRVRNDWEFPWPLPTEKVFPPSGGSQVANEDPGQSPTLDVQDETRVDTGYQVDACSELDQSPLVNYDRLDDEGDDTQSTYSVVSEDVMHYRSRIELTSDLSDDDTSVSLPSLPFNGIDSMRMAMRKRCLERQSRHRRALRNEMVWNDGLACFEARRNAWTGAKTARVRRKSMSPPSASPRSPRRFFFRHPTSGSPPAPTVAATHGGDASAAPSDALSLGRDHDKEMKKYKTHDSSTSDVAPPELYSVETLVPVGQPLLPPSNSLRASITPAVYASLYDKVVLNNLQPACPINLADMLRSCVAGWKRDGEWPPGSVDTSQAVRLNKKAVAAGNGHGGNVARRMSFGLLNREKEDDGKTGKGLRRSLQRALGIGLGPGNTATTEGVKTKEA